MHETIAEAPKPDFHIPLGAPSPAETAALPAHAPDTAPADYLPRAVRKDTEIETRQGAINLAIAPAKAEAPVQAELALRKHNVDGNVLEVSEASVRCELQLERGAVVASLPRTFFPPNIRYGTPISITIDESGTVRRPVVSLRKIDHERLKAENEEMAKMVTSLKP